MTQELFREDAYRQECTATVVRVDDDGVVLDATVFYPEGGASPATAASCATRTAGNSGSSIP